MELFKIPLTFKNRLRETEPFNEVTLSLHLSFYTSGQVKYTDTNDRPKIVEFNGTNWSIDLLLKPNACTEFSVFIMNSKKLENQILTLTKKINSNIINNKTFVISTVNTYDGWFKLE